MTPTKNTVIEWRDPKLNWNLTKTYKVELKFKWYNWVETSKAKLFQTKKKAEEEKQNLLQKIRKNWWMELTYNHSYLKSLFIFESQFQTISLRLCEATEKVIKVNKLLA